MAKIILTADNLWSPIAPSKNKATKKAINSLKKVKTLFDWGLNSPAENMYWDEYGNPVYLDELSI
jgi:hypothetical protein